MSAYSDYTIGLEAQHLPRPNRPDPNSGAPSGRHTEHRRRPGGSPEAEQPRLRSSRDLPDVHRRLEC
ncbi:hypothetical protein ACFYWU_34610 [Streptomyces chrestomyceticus]|uniref:hypothetical protein n=1 Tax=Streptomyces chrestomyceticus TaxID=68185 RepID=UPI0036847163